MATAYLGLGANLGEAIDMLRQAITSISEVDGVTLIDVSRLYRTKPVGGPAGQPDYHNAVIVVTSVLTPREMLDCCLAIEQRLGRVRIERWGARSIDVDLLLYDQITVDEPGLKIPHPRLRDRLFVLLPLLDVAAKGLKLPPDSYSLQTLVDEANSDGRFVDQMPVEVIENGLAFADRQPENIIERIF